MTRFRRSRMRGAPSGAPLEAALATYLKSARGAVSDNTERAIRSDAEIFEGWCRQQGLTALPAEATTVVAFIDAMARVRAPATVRRYVASIATLHKVIRQQNPLETSPVQFALQRMHRQRGRRQAQVQGLTWPLRQRLIGGAGERLIHERNRALLAVAYDTLLRRSELVSLLVRDLLFEMDGTATVLVPRSKTDPEGHGATVFLARDTVKLVRRWLTGSGVDDGRLFRSLRGAGAVGEKLDASQVPRIYKEMARHAGLNEDLVVRLSGHSPRVGAVQDMIASGIELPAILQAGRWKSTDMVQRYGERLLARRSGAAKLARLQNRA